MSNLGSTLADVRDRIARYGGRRKLNEQNTKATLIEPVLRALGWNVEDVDEVQREYKGKRRDRPVDYALLLLRTPRLLLEAKALGQDLNDRRWINQIMGYATVAGVEWTVLTDGDEYRLYNSHAPVAVDQKLFRSFRISDAATNPEQTLVLLSRTQMAENAIDSLWQRAFIDRQVERALNEMFDGDTDSGLVRLIRKHAANLSPAAIRASLERADVNVTFPPLRLPELQPAATTRRTPRTQRTTVKSPRPKPGTAKVDATVAQLIHEGLLKVPVQLVRRYKNVDVFARVEADGRITHGGDECSSLSKAGGLAKQSVSGPDKRGSLPATGGWTFWQIESDDGSRVPIDELRQRLRK